MTRPAKPQASLSLDLDNLWSYLKTHGDEAWQDYPSYLDLAVPRILERLRAHDLKVTVFIVGQDAALERNGPALKSIAAAGHEVGNHSFRHEPWLHLYTDEEVEAELARAETAIEAATGAKPVGFRGPGFSFSPQVLEAVRQRGYAFDASAFPTFIGPAARAYYFLTSGLNKAERERRQGLFGSWTDGFRPLRPYVWDLPGGPLLEMPVTTMPLMRAPFHFSYLNYLLGYSKAAALAYFRSALALCRLFQVEPSLLLHPTDFLGAEDVHELGFFPGMQLPAARKLAFLDEAFALLTAHFEMLPMGAHMAAIQARGSLPRRRPPRFAQARQDAAQTQEAQTGRPAAS